MGDAAAFLGMTQSIYEKTYRHHSPTIVSPGFHSPPTFEILDPQYHPREVLFDDGWDGHNNLLCSNIINSTSYDIGYAGTYN